MKQIAFGWLAGILGGNLCIGMMAALGITGVPANLAIILCSAGPAFIATYIAGRMS